MTISHAAYPVLRSDDLDDICINTIRATAVDAVERANSGHPGMPMGAAPLAYVLWTRFLRHNPRNPDWPDRDRFVLSAGHASMLLYALLHLTGYDVPLEELRRFRQWGSRTPGHPEHGLTPGVETTTGPLGQGFGNAVGMAMGERLLASRFNRPGFDVVDHCTYAICSDGDMMEGVASEAASLAGHLGLGKLVCLYDDNGISIDGTTDLSFSEDVGRRFEAYRWHVQHVADGTDVGILEKALAEAREEAERPSLIVVRTHIGFGAPSKQDTAEAHGAPLGADEVAAWKERIGWPENEFFIPDAARRRFGEALERGAELERGWRRLFDRWAAADPELAAEWDRAMAGQLPPGWEHDLPDFQGQTTLSTRKASGKVLAALAPRLHELVGGSADLTESTNAGLPGETPFSRERPGRSVHFGVREHGMGAILNGLSLHGGLRPFGSTFLIFSDYMRPSMRLAALMGQPVVYVLTHDSIALGEDGPTHEPVEHMASLRAMPGLVVIRPADAAETREAWKVALERREGPTAIVLSRQELPVLDRDSLAPADLLARGAYVLADADGRDDLVLLASGSEVHVSLAAAELLRSEHGLSARVVSMPSWELFEQQEQTYRRRVLPPDIPVRLAVEAAATFGWSRWTGDADAIVGIDRFGASAPGSIVLERFGFTAENVATRALELLSASRPPLTERRDP